MKRPTWINGVFAMTIEEVLNEATTNWGMEDPWTIELYRMAYDEHKSEMAIARRYTMYVHMLESGLIEWAEEWKAY